MARRVNFPWLMNGYWLFIVIGPIVRGIVSLIRHGGSHEYWINLAIVVPISIAILLVIAGIIWAYVRFCDWFDRVTTRKRPRTDASLRSTNLIGYWPATDPLHDREIDG